MHMARKPETNPFRPTFVAKKLGDSSPIFESGCEFRKMILVS